MTIHGRRTILLPFIVSPRDNAIANDMICHPEGAEFLSRQYDTHSLGGGCLLEVRFWYHPGLQFEDIWADQLEE